MMLPYEIHEPTGDIRGSVVAIHGWPDSEKLWSKYVIPEFTSNGFRLMTLTLPLFSDKNIEKYDKWGYDFPKLVEMMKNTIDSTDILDDNNQIILLGHDWGSYLCYLFRMHFPEMVSKLVQVDIGAHVTPTILERLGILLYQLCLASFWFLPSSIGNILTYLEARLLGVSNLDNVKSRMNYPYYYMLKRIFFDHDPRYNAQKYRIDCPIFFGYGKEKPFMFHSKKWIESIEKRGDSIQRGYDCDHWVVTHDKEGPRISNDIVKWLLQSSL